jgi:endoglucanase
MKSGPVVSVRRVLRSVGSLRRPLVVGTAVAVVATLSTAVAEAAVPQESSTSAAPQLHVSGNELVNSDGQRVILHGVDRSGTEYMCVDGYGIFDGPNTQASIKAMVSWHINAVRVLLNEACWDGSSYVRSQYSGSNYRDAIKTYVSRLNAAGIVAILDLHWSNGAYYGGSDSCDSAEAICQKPMPDLGAVTFWSSVARTFGQNDSVIFDLFNEPFPESANGNNETQAWECWRNGSPFCSGISYAVAGMQELVTAVRATGATNVLMLGGLDYANDLTQWLRYEPTDPLHNLAASWHSYNFNACNTVACWNSQIAPVIARVPVIAGEIGESDCSDTYLDTLMPWLDAHDTSYVAFTWDVWPGSCNGYPALISSYSGTPTSYGAAYRAHLATLARQDAG